MGIKERWKGFKPLPEDIKERVSNLAPVFQRGEVLLAYLFGSLTRREQGKDVDLAVLPGRENFAELRENIRKVLDTQRFDLVNLKSAPSLLKFEIIRDGTLIYKKDEVIENEFELCVLREYKDRAPVRKKQMEILKERTRKRWS